MTGVEKRDTLEMILSYICGSTLVFNKNDDIFQYIVVNILAMLEYII